VWYWCREATAGRDSKAPARSASPQRYLASLADLDQPLHGGLMLVAGDVEVGHESRDAPAQLAGDLFAAVVRDVPPVVQVASMAGNSAGLPTCAGPGRCGGTRKLQTRPRQLTIELFPT
jgi:hypothetical protein